MYAPRLCPGVSCLDNNVNGNDICESLQATEKLIDTMLNNGLLPQYMLVYIHSNM